MHLNRYFYLGVKILALIKITLFMPECRGLVTKNGGQ